MGCDEGQGFLPSRPLDINAMQAVLEGRLPWSQFFEPMSVEVDAIDMDQDASRDGKP